MGILKDRMKRLTEAAVVCCRGLDPIGDTESYSINILDPGLGELQRARSDWGY